MSQGLGKKNNTGTKLSLLFVLGMLVLILVLPMIVHEASFASRPTSRTTTSTTTPTTTTVTTTTTTTVSSSSTSSGGPGGGGGGGGGSISLSYSLFKPNIIVSLSAKDSQLPSKVIVALSSYLNGSQSAFNSQSYTVSVRGSGSVSYTFTVPYAGNGSYLFVGSIYTTSGSLLAQTSIDPRVDPDW